MEAEMQKRERKLKPGVVRENMVRDSEEGESLWLLDEDAEWWLQEQSSKKDDNNGESD
jgi:hypothetical protein